MEQKLKELEQRLDRIESRQASDQQKPVDYDTNLYMSVKNLLDFIEVVSVIPTQVPRNTYEQIKIYISGATYRFYIYNYENNVWRYTTLT